MQSASQSERVPTGPLPISHGDRPQSDQPAIGLFVDVANAQDVDFRQLLGEVGLLGHVVEARAYGDFRQYFLVPIAIELFVLGIDMLHCPSWPNGGQLEDGTRRRKMTDDRLMEKGARDLGAKQPEISTYVFVTSDADVIATCHSLVEQGKRVVLFCPNMDRSLGHVLRQCPFQIEPAPMLPERNEPASLAAPDVELVAS